jgi:hypothetical protein
MNDNATIYEAGNGFPEAGDYVPGRDGNLYYIIEMGCTINTGRGPGQANWMRAEVEEACWSDLPEEGEDEDYIFPASLVPD